MFFTIFTKNNCYFIHFLILKMKHILFIFLLLPMLLWSQTDFDKGEKLYEQGKYVLAKPYFEVYLKQSHEFDANHLKTLEYLGDIEVRDKSWYNAILYYEKLKKLKPAEENYY